MNEEKDMPDKGICQVCGEELGPLRVNPYIEELDGEIVCVYICDDCLYELCQNI